jgi:hypothetical protein
MTNKTLAEQYRELLLLRIEVARAEQEAAVKDLKRMDEKRKEKAGTNDNS